MKKLTIGMPVFNGAATIRAALDCLLAQTFADFQIVISDNASTDRKFAKRMRPATFALLIFVKPRA